MSAAASSAWLSVSPLASVWLSLSLSLSAWLSPAHRASS